MDARLQQLAELEKIFQEFYDPFLSNQRKTQLEQIIAHIKAQPDAYINARFYISNSQNQYLLFFAVSIYEEMIRNGKWESLSIGEQTDLRNLLFEFLLAKYKNVPSYVCNKIAKVIVDIGKNDWPHKYPDFFTNIQRLMQNMPTSSLGVNMITLVSEEFVTPKDDLLAARKMQLKQLLTSYLPTVLSQLTQILDTLYDQARMQSMPSPHSPAHHIALGGSVGSPGHHSPLGPLSPISPLSPVHPRSPGLPHSPKPNSHVHFDKDSEALVKVVFDTLQQLFSWIPLSDLVKINLINTLFKYAQIGDSNGVAALGCINEILSKSYVPREFEEFLMAVFHQLVLIMQSLTQSAMVMQSADPDYVERVTYFISLFVKNHLRRVKTSPNFPVLDFLRLLFTYTFAQPASDATRFTACLDIWGSFLDMLSSSPLEDRRVYFDGLMALQLELQKKSLFNTNSAQLQNLDSIGDSTSKLDEEEESGSELDMFISRCLEIVSKVAELFPKEVVDSLYPLFGQNMENFFRVAQVWEASDKSQGVLNQVINVVTDMGTVTRLFGRLVNIFVMDFEAKFQATILLYSKMLEMIHYVTVSNLLSLPSLPDFCCRVIGSLHAFTHWLEAYTTHSGVRTAGNTAPGYNEYAQLITRILEAVTPLISWVQHQNQQQQQQQQHNSPHAHAHGNNSPLLKAVLSPVHSPKAKEAGNKYATVGVQVGHLVESLCASVRPPMLVGLPPFEALVNGIHSVAPHLPSHCAAKLYTAITAGILFPQPSMATTPQQWEAKRVKYVPFLKILTNAYVEVSQIPGFVDNKIFAQEEVQRRVIFTSQMLASIVRFVTNEPTQVKAVVFEGLGDSLSITLGFFRVYVGTPQCAPVLEQILDFFLSVFESLPAHVGVPFTQQTINTFLEKLSEQKQVITEVRAPTGNPLGLSGGISKQDVGSVVLTKLLQILTVVMSKPGTKYESLLPAVVSFCLDHVYLQVTGSPGPNGTPAPTLSLDVRNQLYILLYTLLLHHWKAVGNMQQTVLKALEHPFSMTDVALFKQTLEAFESLNSKIRLYENFPTPTHRFDLLRTLLCVLLAKSHDILRDEIIIAIYNMAAVEFDSFFKQFLGNFLASASGLNDPQRHHLLSNFAPDKDQPTFNTHITQFINDYRYFLNRNTPSTS